MIICQFLINILFPIKIKEINEKKLPFLENLKQIKCKNEIINNTGKLLIFLMLIIFLILNSYNKKFFFFFRIIYKIKIILFK